MYAIFVGRRRFTYTFSERRPYADGSDGYIRGNPQYVNTT